MQLSVNWFQWAAPILSGIVAMWLILVFWPEEDPTAGEGPIGSNQGRQKRPGIFLKVFGGVIDVMAGFFAALPMPAYREKLRIKLVAAGSPGGLDADQYNAARVIAVVLAGVAGSFIDNETGLTPIITFSLCGLGIFYPDIWLSDLIQKRRRRIFRDLPDFLDILRLAVDAGLDLSSALKVAVEKGRRGPLMDEMEKVERDIALGRTRREAFRSFADRLGMSEINAFVLALIQADQLGASIGPILKVQAEVARTKRWQLAEVIVNKMPMKMLGPLIVFIFPASFIILFTPLLIQYLQAPS